MNLNRSVLVMAMVVGALGGTGCKTKVTASTDDTGAAQAPAPPPPPAATPAPTPVATEQAAPAGTDSVASAPVGVPPVDRVEVQGPAPSPKHIWVKGYWHWAGREYAWNPGYWEDPDLAAPSAPPALRVEVAGTAPSANHFYAPGYWRWSGREYLWAPGHWAPRQAGYAYTHPHYEVVGGRYVRRGYGWERQDAAWTKRYNGWEHPHGDVWVHKAEVVEWNRRGEHEGWGRKVVIVHH